MNKLVLLVAVIGGVGFSLLAPLGAVAAAPVLRLSGSFLQYWDEMESWPPENWRAVLDQLTPASSQLEVTVVVHSDSWSSFQ